MGLADRSRSQWRECYERAMDDLRHARRRATLAEERLEAVRDFVDDPGNWSAADGRRSILLILIDGLPHVSQVTRRHDPRVLPPGSTEADQ